MLYNVAQLLKEPVGSTRRYALSEDVEFPGEEWGPLRADGEVSLLRTPRGILVQAEIRTAVPEECGRCLEPYSQQVLALIEEEYLPVTDVNTGLPVRLPRNEDTFLIDEKHLLDLAEALRQAVWVEKPLQPLCRPDCAGLCTECGQDLNRGTCRCERAPADLRWEQLKKLLA